MQEDIIFKRRNRLKKHFTNTSNVLLYCYAFVSDAAKITFQIIDGFDWESKETGNSKGYVFPAVETIARIRHTSVRTIQRHILELIKAKLLTRIRQRNKPSILYIEEVSDTEVETYFAFFEPKEKQPVPQQPDTASQLRNDKNVVPDTHRETTKMSFAYYEEDKKEEHEMNVNDNFTPLTQRTRGEAVPIGNLLTRYALERQHQARPKPRKARSEAVIRRDFVAEDIARALGDQKSMGAFRTIAQRVPEGVIREFLAAILETWREGKIKKSRGALFISMIQSYAEAHQIDLGFRTSGRGEPSR